MKTENVAAVVCSTAEEVARICELWFKAGYSGWLVSDKRARVAYLDNNDGSRRFPQIQHSLLSWFKRNCKKSSYDFCGTYQEYINHIKEVGIPTPQNTGNMVWDFHTTYPKFLKLCERSEEASPDDIKRANIDYFVPMNL